MPFFVGVLLATAATSVPDALGDVLAAAHRDNIAQAADKFAPPTVDERSDGAPFRVVLPIADGTINGRDPPNSSFFAYKPDEGVLELHLSPIGERTTGRGSDGLMDVLTFEVFRLGRRVAAGPSYAGQNVFGVSARVSVVRERYDAIAVLDAPGVTNLKDIHYPTYDVALSLAGPDARKVAADAVVEIEGKLARLDNGHLARCTSDYSGPTVRHPTEKSMVTCSAGAIIRRIAFVRKSTGEVLKEWLTDDTAAAGPVLWQRVRYGMTLKQFALAYPDLDWPKYRSSIRIVDGSSVATVNASKGLVTSVEATLEGVSPKQARAEFIGRYGRPQVDRCTYVDTVCSSEWLTPEGVRVKFSSIGLNYVRAEYEKDGSPKW